MVKYNVSIFLQHYLHVLIWKSWNFHLIQSLKKEFQLYLKFWNLKKLNTSYFSIGVGALVIAQSIQNNKSLLDSNLSNNKIGFEGAKAFAKALEINETIRTLEIGGNNIEKEGIIVISNALDRNSKTFLEFLDISNNWIDDQGGLVFANILFTNTSLKDIDLENNAMSEKVADEIQETFKINKFIQSVEWVSIFQ